MKAAVLYYSFDGSSALIAQALGKELGADLFPLELQDDKKRTGLAKYAWGGRQVFMKQSPALKPYSINPDQYELLIIGGPVWAGSPAPALRTFLGETKISGKKIALFLCHGGGPGKALDKLKSWLPGNTFIGAADFVTPVKQDPAKLSAKVKEWIDRVKS
jgi:flavodoxin